MDIVLGKSLDDRIYQFDRSDVDYFLNVNFLPSDLRNVNDNYSIVNYRQKYPVAWLSKDLPQIWLERAKQQFYSLPRPLFLFIQKPEGLDEDEVNELVLYPDTPQYYVGGDDMFMVKHSPGQRFMIQNITDNQIEFRIPEPVKLIWFDSLFQPENEKVDVYKFHGRTGELYEFRIDKFPGTNSAQESLLFYLMTGYKRPIIYPQDYHDQLSVDFILQHYYIPVAEIKKNNVSVKEDNFTSDKRFNFGKYIILKEMESITGFNNNMADYALIYYNKANNEYFPTREQLIDKMLENNIPADLTQLNLSKEVYYRYHYPYVWPSFIFPVEWIQRHDDIYYSKKWLVGKTDDMTGINIVDLNHVMSNGWPNDFQNRVIRYNQFMKLLDIMPPLPHPITLFRGIIMDIPNIGDIITEHGFSSKTPYYHVANKFGTVFIISYPANHKFFLPIGGQKRSLYFEAMSYPGEQLRVMDVRPEGIYCEFIGYEAHLTPGKIRMVPILTDIIGTAKNVVGNTVVLDDIKRDNYAIIHAFDRQALIPYLQELSVYLQLENEDVYEVETALNYLLHRWIAPKDLPDINARLAGLLDPSGQVLMDLRNKYSHVAQTIDFMSQQIKTLNPRTIFISQCDTIKCLWDKRIDLHSAIFWRGHLSQNIPWDKVMEIEHVLDNLLAGSQYNVISTRRGQIDRPINSIILLLSDEIQMEKISSIMVATITESYDPRIIKVVIQTSPSKIARLLEVHIRPADEYYFALLNLTGPDSFVSSLTKHASDEKMFLFQNRLVRTGQTIKVDSEEDIFKQLKLDYVDPKLR